MPPAATSKPPSRIRREAAWLLVFLFLGLVLLPVAIYAVGIIIFGEYGGAGFGDFFSEIGGEFRSGEPAVVFLAFSPYLIWLLCRLTYWAYKRSTPTN